MSGFLGKSVTQENVPGDIAGLRKGFADYLTSGGFGGLNTGAPDLQPYKDLFTQQNAQTFAQAKESAGNLTGTGYGNRIGAAAQRTAVEQGGFLANLLEQSKQANASRMAQVLLPFLNTGVAPPSQSYQPGFLDYLTQGASGVLSAVGGAGGFGQLFGGGGGGGSQRGNMTQSGGR